MIQIFIVGSSSTYGVGGESGSWADMLKRSLHQRMYSTHGVGEKYEIYNFGISGATIDFVKRTFPQQLQEYGRGHTVITVVAVGGNNAKAENEPDNFVSTKEEYIEQMSELMDVLTNQSNHVIAVGGGFFDETKTNPKLSPLTGGLSYFTNVRKQAFEAEWKKICEHKQIPFVDVRLNEAEWKSGYIYSDGLHPNNNGYEYICNNLMKEIDKLL